MVCLAMLLWHGLVLYCELACGVACCGPAGVVWDPFAPTGGGLVAVSGGL